MTVKGPIIDTPVQMLQEVYNQIQEHNKLIVKNNEELTKNDPNVSPVKLGKTKSMLERAKERPKRLFSDILKEAHRPTHDSEFFKNDGFKEFKRMLLEHKMPVTEDLVNDTKTLFTQLDTSFTNDPNWQDFWDKVREKDNLTDEEVTYLQNQALVSYRFKLMSNAMNELVLDKDIPKDKKDNAKQVLALLQIYNGNYLEYQDDLGNKTKNDYQNKSALVYVQDTNIALAEGIKMLKDGKSLDEIKKIMEVKREDVFKVNKEKDNYAMFYGEEGAREVFDEYFSIEKVMDKISNYQKVCEEVGFDVDERAQALTKIKNEMGAHIGDSNIVAVENHAILTKKLAYFSELQLKTNDEVNKQPTVKEYKEAVEKLNDKIAYDISRVLQAGDLERLKTYTKAGVTDDSPKTDYKRGFLNTLKDGFKDFPKNLKHLLSKPPRTAKQIAQMNGATEVVNLLENVSKSNAKLDDAIQKSSGQDIVKELNTKLENVSTPPQKPLPKLPEFPELPKIPLPIRHLRQETKPTIHPIALGVMNEMDNLLKEIASEQKKATTSKDPLDAKLLEIERQAITSVRDFLKTVDLDTPEGKSMLKDKIEEALKTASAQRRDSNNGYLVDHPTITNKVKEVLHSAQAEVSQPEKTSKFGKNL